MWKKRILCLVLVLCSILVLSSCQKKETFMTLDQQQQLQQQQQQTASQSSDAQNLFGETALPQQNTIDDFDSGDYDPSQEEGGDEEFLETLSNIVDVQTPAPTMKSEYAGATPVLVDPIDKPTPTPLPPLTFNYEKYEASALHLTFEGPAGWVKDDSMPDTYILTNPTAGVDYAAQLSIQLGTLSDSLDRGKADRQTALDALQSHRDTLAVLKQRIDALFGGAGRMIISCVNKTLYILHVSYPQGYTSTYVDNVYDKFRHTVKIIDTTAAAATKTN